MPIPAIVPIAAAALAPAILALKNVIGQAKDQLKDATATTERKKLQKLINSREGELNKIVERKKSKDPITSKDLKGYDFLNKVIKVRKENKKLKYSGAGPFTKDSLPRGLKPLNKDKMYNGGMVNNKKHMYATNGKATDRRKK
jgi:hypothetical protein